ncbi:hypothetical protein LA080_008649 [Diaporthe eres]|nr:hypothetical protein LA080_008649 [Diaporthe eres]
MFWTVWLRSLAVLSPFWKAAEGIDGPIPQVGDPHGDWEDVPVWRWKIWRAGNGPTRRIPSRRADEVRPWRTVLGILCIQFLPNNARYCIQFALEGRNKTPAAIGGPNGQPESVSATASGQFQFQFQFQFLRQTLRVSVFQKQWSRWTPAASTKPSISPCSAVAPYAPCIVPEMGP